MVKIEFESHRGDVRTVEAQAGETVMQAALNGDIGGILGDCGGCLSCATCHVHIPEEWADRTGKPSAEELEMLDMAVDPDERSRLSCQIKLSEELDGLRVILPASQL
ncbi:2Fe-2S iron-sulfur cluster-binding protein [Novosphingobium aquimarinum]|uniref:2Fe-2S iron-sulfur cluster-binding protein n=1 Tax=Novosphingobium aquimarinum TaxID=2682494 RepID=UPI0012EC992E|nr:2Fe-2S iron-sulfur cluster-binding protein [Novosphingobium aquimarinum]